MENEFKFPPFLIRMLLTLLVSFSLSLLCWLLHVLTDRQTDGPAERGISREKQKNKTKPLPLPLSLSRSENELSGNESNCYCCYHHRRRRLRCLRAERKVEFGRPVGWSGRVKGERERRKRGEMLPHLALDRRHSSSWGPPPLLQFRCERRRRSKSGRHNCRCRRLSLVAPPPKTR